LETVPARRVPDQGRLLEEMDLDAILTRHPCIVLVEELAHTNAPGSRHPKRYLDVGELLDAGIEELFARIRAAQRHRLQRAGEEAVFRGGDLSVDLVRRIVTVRGAEVKFSPREYALLRLLVQHAGKVLTHRHILREVWGSETDIQYLRVYIRALRQKIERDPERPAHIITETGVGYRLRMVD
jgi:hypothetical protein